MLSEPAASKLLLEAIVPYDKNSCLGFLRQHQLEIESQSVGFCSDGMAVLLARAARNRALHLTPKLQDWPLCVGVASTATIVSHYQRRGDYRCHAASISAKGNGHQYTHVMKKGERSRSGEDSACALLTIRALAHQCDIKVDELETVGLRLVEEEGVTRVNEVGEKSQGVETVPDAVPVVEEFKSSSVLVPSPVSDEPQSFKSCFTSVAVPSQMPPESFIVVDFKHPAEAIRSASKALEALKCQGDGGKGSWAIQPSPTFFNVKGSKDAEGQAMAFRGTRMEGLTNWGVLHTSSVKEDESAFEYCVAEFADSYFVVNMAKILAMLESVSGQREALIGAAAKGAKFVVVESDDLDERLRFSELVDSLTLRSLKEALTVIEKRDGEDLD
jgi:hypothetical protein